jgi:hypothetical protein
MEAYFEIDDSKLRLRLRKRVSTQCWQQVATGTQVARVPAETIILAEPRTLPESIRQAPLPPAQHLQPCQPVRPVEQLVLFSRGWEEMLVPWLLLPPLPRPLAIVRRVVLKQPWISGAAMDLQLFLQVCSPVSPWLCEIHRRGRFCTAYNGIVLIFCGFDLSDEWEVLVPLSLSVCFLHRRTVCVCVPKERKATLVNNNILNKRSIISRDFNHVMDF